jgi:hypothetical protein
MRSFLLRITLPILVATASGSSSRAQTAGDTLFDSDQVISIALTFDDPNFWITLLMNHQAGAEATVPAAATIVDQSGTYTFDSVAVRLKGNSSFDFYPTDKKPIKLDFDTHINGQKYHGLKKLNLSNNWGDPTSLREKVFMDVCRREGVLAPRVSYANVSLNGQFWGFYSVIEQVDKTFLDRWLNDNDGDLFKAGDNYTPDGGGLGLEADLNHYGNSASNYTGRYELKTNETLNDWTELIELLDFIDNSSSTDLVNGMPDRFAMDDLMRSLALDNLFGNMDAYYGTARNYYLYRDSTTLKWNWVHWDANMSFGRYVPQWVNDVAALPATYTSPGRRLLQRIMSSQALKQAYLVQYCDLFERFTNAELDPYIDQLHDLVQPHVYADNNKEFGNADFELNIDQTTTAFSGGFWWTMPGLKSFIAERRTNLLNSTLDCSSVGLEEVAQDQLSAYPNPTNGPLHIALPRGARYEDLVLVDALGRTVQPRYTATGIDLSDLPAGSYLMTLQLGGAQARAMVVKQ